MGNTVDINEAQLLRWGIFPPRLLTSPFQFLLDAMTLSPKKKTSLRLCYMSHGCSKLIIIRGFKLWIEYKRKGFHNGKIYPNAILWGHEFKIFGKKNSWVQVSKFCNTNGINTIHLHCQINLCKGGENVGRSAKNRKIYHLQGIN